VSPVQQGLAPNQDFISHFLTSNIHCLYLAFLFSYELEMVVGEKVAAMVRKLNTVLESWQVCKCILQQMMLGFVNLYAV